MTAIRLLASLAAFVVCLGSAQASIYFTGTVSRVGANLYEAATGEIVNTSSCGVTGTGIPSVLRIDTSGGGLVGEISFETGGGSTVACNLAGVYAAYGNVPAGNYNATLTSIDPDVRYYGDTTVAPFWIVLGAQTCPSKSQTPSHVTLAAAGPTYLGGAPIGTLTFNPDTSPESCGLIAVYGEVDLLATPSFPLAVSKSGDGSVASVSVPAAISCGATCSANFGPGTLVTLVATPGAGSVFAGWNGDCSGTGTCQVTMDAARNVSATFAAPGTLTLSVSKGGTGDGTVTSTTPVGINCGMTCSANFNAGAMVTLAASAAPGSTFTAWGGACAGVLTQDPCVVTMNAAQSVTATFTATGPISYALTVSKSGTGSGTVTSLPPGISCGGTCTATFASGASVELTATPDAQSVFAGWSGAGCSGTGTCTAMMDAAHSVVATFVTALPTSYILTVSKAGTGTGTVTSSPAGINCGATCSASFTARTTVALSAVASPASTFAGWSGACTGTGACSVAIDAAKSVTATFTVPPLTPSPASLSFGGQSMNTTAPALSVTLTNASGGSLSVTSVTASTYFAVTHNCPTTVAAGAFCAASVTFTPTALGSLNGTLTIVSSAGTQTVPLIGTGEKSLVTHYYRSILRRAPDAGGKAYWESEASRMTTIGVNVNETWYSMAGSFYTSAEYLAFGRDNNGFVTDLYNTFFNRPPDGAGLAYWTGQLNAGLPREVALVGFMFSPEFVNFTQAIFGNTTTRKEIDTIVDFYRGLLARLPDNGGFAFWVQQFRAAQCQGAAAVTAQAEAISSAYALSAEYAARNRSNAQYVGDLYNAFLRRGGDLAGVQFWIGQVATGAQTREQVRKQFVASPEFSARVAAIIAQGCLP